jgi:diamine N-acetyltransferase
MHNATVTLREITADTFSDICKLSLTLEPPQNKAVARNAYSLAEASFYDSAWTRAIYAGDTPVGFLMLDDKPSEPLYFLWRFMIAAPHQGKGYGRQAISLLIDHVKTRPAATQLLVSCIEGEGSPEHFYTSCGFTRTGVMHESEAELVIDLQTYDPAYQPLPADPTDEGPAPRHRTASLIRNYFDRVINQRDLTAAPNASPLNTSTTTHLPARLPGLKPPSPTTNGTSVKTQNIQFRSRTCL